MNMMRTVFCLLLAFSAAASAQETVSWNSPDYARQFKYIQERNLYTSASWAVLPPAEQARELEKYRGPAAARQEAVRRSFAEGMRLWGTAAARQYIAAGTDTVKPVFLWQGREDAQTLFRKLTVVRSAFAKAGARGIDAADAAALGPYLTAEAINALKAARSPRATGVRPTAAGATAAGSPAAGAGTVGGLERFAGTDHSNLNAGGLAKFYDGQVAAGNDPVALGGGRSPAGGRPAGAAQPVARLQPPVRADGVPPPVEVTAKTEAKSSGIMPDAYGITVYTRSSGQPAVFRSGTEAEGYLRGLSDGSVSRVVFYGHGSPGLQTVGSNYDVDAEKAAQLLRGKMAANGVVMFEGCNTAGVGTKTSINPLYGLSIVARRLMYFSLPYFQDRLEGRSADDARRMWEGEWNKDLAREASQGLRGAIVCGNRTFGLVPERLPGVAQLTGRMEAASPAYVMARKACYRNGEEVPVP
ncbi:MAG: hypothetical protein NTY45_15855 [Elusimicrobia bacterium]|nr:hypothetical protein [Elusimicrobiota bacterium]